MPSLNDRMGQANSPVLKRITGTTSGTANTTTTHAHGLTDYAGRAVVPNIVILVPGAGATSHVYEQAAADATNISVRSPGTSIAFVAYVG